ncbi:hypothetical protein Tco_0913121 [Tanacetum coccineum]
MKVKESLNVTFDESPPSTKLSPVVDDDVGEEETIKKNTKVVNNNEEDESIEVDKIVNIKESKNRPLDQVIGTLNQRTLRTLESRYVHEVRTIDPSFYNDLSDDLVAKFTAIGDRKDKVLPYGMILTCLFRNLKENMAEHLFDERYKLVPRKMSSLKAKQPKKPPPKRTRNVRKSKRTQLSTSSSTESSPSDNGDFPSTKLSPRSYSRALKDDPNMSKEQRETRGMFKNLRRSLHNFARMLKKGCR